ncbi:CPBP family intramembrane glutamic endopeptidase [Humisphaera borealis]|uniref:CPBP family intramembrane metalloprotease n=1 Tax=Humisphaera borealis TaxID=2807512 RepID=A0A7M2WWL7_9BACT|nr:CPBP family intramembrane glutamic endopeptidase [Humisphaera borealis]QOV89789.1 CPBP family intramembrane metalloprotease [Humisphaera borealis]
MSIIAAADPDLTSIAIELLVVAVLLVPGIIVLWKTGSYRWRSVLGPLRIPDRAEMWPVPVALVIGFAGWMGSAVAYTVLIGIRSAAGGASQPTGEADLMAMLSPLDFVVLAAVTPVVGLIAGVAFLILVRPAAVGWIGFKPGRLPRGLALGALAALIGVPLTMLAGGITELVYKAIDFKHPAEHELLKFMKEAPSMWIQVAAILAAVAIAPLVEEFLFRGLIQTSLMTWFHGFGRLRGPVAYAPQWQMQGNALPYASAAVPAVDPATGQPIPAGPPAGIGLSDTTPLMPPPELGQVVPPAPVAPQPLPELSRRPWASWLAIVITSVLFAVIHPLWTAPIIFVLAVVLGYVYERTGNLWASIGLHAIFNTISTTIYLLGVGQT